MSSIHVTWTDENENIILFTFRPDWVWQDFTQAGLESIEMMQAAGHPVVQIFDMRNANNIPRNTFSQGREALNQKPHPNLEKVIVVGMNGYFNAIFRAFEKMLPSTWIEKWNMTFVDSLEEAVVIAHEELSHATRPR